MTYPRAYIAVAINYFDIFEWLALQIERDLPTVTASLIDFLRRVDIGRVWNVWRSICGRNCSPVVHIDLQLLRIKILQGAGLDISSVSQIWVLISGIQTLIEIDGFWPCLCPNTGVPQFGQNFIVSEPYSTRRFVKNMSPIDLVYQRLFAKHVTLQSASTLLHYEIIHGCKGSPQVPFLE